MYGLKATPMPMASLCSCGSDLRHCTVSNFLCPEPLTSSSWRGGVGSAAASAQKVTNDCRVTSAERSYANLSE